MIEEGGRRFPGDRRIPGLLAQAAEERGEWARALAIWDAASAAAPDPAQVAVGRARALFRLDRVDEAVAMLEDCWGSGPTTSRRGANCL